MLKRILCKKLPEPNHPVLLEESEAIHAMRVLRLKDGDCIEAMDGKGHAATTRLRTRSGEPRLEFVESPESQSPLALPITLEMAVLKGDAMEWVVEKSVELGATTLVPVLTAHTVVQMDRKGPEAFRERWQKIADQALKQCGRLNGLHVAQPISLEEMLSRPCPGVRLFCDETVRRDALPLLRWLEDSRTKNLSPLHALIGPEGGFSQKERELLEIEKGEKLVPVSLGPWVLRAETAAIAVLSLLASDLRLRLI